MRVELHSHSRFSDGTASPGDVVGNAAKAGVSLLFLTDHDTVAGFPEALEAASGRGIDVRCGIEINTATLDSVHILGYGIRWKDPAFLARLAEFRGRRDRRVRRIVEQLRAKGLDITFDDVRRTSHETLGRPHVADALRRKGLVANRQEAFNRFLIKGKPGYVESMGPTAREAIELIRDAGGFCSLAHPDTVSDKEAVAEFVEWGLEGLEVYYNTHTPSDIVRYSDLASRHGLLATGGTDYHGPGTGREGRLGVDLSEEDYGRFMERLARCS